MTKQDFILAGVGGQGTILAGELLAKVGKEAGYDVKKSEVHGMAQHGGSVVSHVRWGDKVYSPLIPFHQADFLLAFEKLESLRWVRFLSPDGMALVADHRVPPLSVSLGQFSYPEDDKVMEVLDAQASASQLVPSFQIAQELGNARVNNIVVLGVLSHHISIKEEVWRSVTEDSVPTRFIDLNLEAFGRGRGWAEGRRGA